MVKKNIMPKRYSLLFSLIISLTTLAQQTPIDFSESSHVFSSWGGSSFSLLVAQEEGEFAKNNSALEQGNYIDLSRPIDLDVEDEITLRFYAFDADAHNVVVKLENGTNPDVEVIVTAPSNQNDWSDLTFDFATVGGIGQYSRLTIRIDDGSSVPGTFRIDDINDGNIATDPHAIDVIYDDLVWEDNFDSGSTAVAINSTNWFHQTYAPFYDVNLKANTWFNGEKQHYTDRIDNSYLQNGELNIVLKREDYTPSAQPGAAALKFTSARLNSKFSFTYGRVDVRAKLPARTASWPAIWTLGTNIAEVGGYWYQSGVTNTGWPACGEIDIMEHGLHPDNTTSSAIHVPGRSGGNPFTETFGLTDVVNDYHIYSVNWSPNKIVFLIDDTPNYSVTKTQMEANGGTWVFDLDQYLLLNVAVGGFAGTPDFNDFNDSSMVIDYVRVYQEAPLSIDKVKANNFHVFPNPTRNEINIKTNINIDYIEFYDSFGKFILRKSQDVKSIKLDDFSSGLYLLNIYSNGSRIVKKVIVN